MPSLMEGFGLVFLEAMAQGIPVIGGKTGGTEELINNKENEERQFQNEVFTLIIDTLH